MLDGLEGRGTCATVMPTDEDVIGMRFRDTRCNCAHADTRDQFNADKCLGVDLVKIVDQLCDVFNAINVVMRWRRDKRYMRRCVSQARNKGRHFTRRELPALPRF